MTNSQFEHVTTLQYRLKSYAHRLKEFETGEVYVSMRADIKRIIDSHSREVKGLRSELADARKEVVAVRNIWTQMLNDAEDDHEKELGKMRKSLKAMEERALRAERRNDELTIQVRDAKKELYAVKSELEEANDRNQKLIAQLNRDFENSSVSSSMKQNRKKIHNSREKTGKLPGGQPGHKGHGRKRHEPTKRIEIEPPKEYTDSPNFEPTGKMITKQLISLRVTVDVDELVTPEFKDLSTGQRVHADFPDGVVNDVNYNGSIKAFAFLLNNYCNVAIDKVKDFISEITGGQLEVSHGMICGLSKEFSLKTQTEQKEAFSTLLRSPFMCTDLTGIRVNGVGAYVAVCANSDAVMYFPKDHKGHESVEGTPIKDHQGTLVHDHDKTYYNYGSNHQECLGHPIRYLKGCMENEPNLTWHKEMRELLREMIHYRNLIDENDGNYSGPIIKDVEAYRKKYLDILDIARTEYEWEPPTKYNKDGFNLYKKLNDYIDNHLLFLSDHRIPATNNLSERLLRIVKRKSKQAITFRSFESLGYLCDALGVIAALRMQERNLFSEVTDIFG
jgi:hypothetical protein